VARDRRRGPPRPRRTPQQQIRQILVFVEGERTEDGYFKHWGRQHRSEVIVNIHEFTGAAPLSLVERAVAEQKRERYETNHGRGQPHDEIWCVFDVDAHPKLPVAIQLAATHNINVAVSNPCFELWLVLHYQDQTASIEGREVEKLAKSHLKCGKTLSPQALDALTSRYEEALKRAKALDKKHDGDGSPPRTNPSSEVWKLVERIRS
jgi:RloB-like protein